MLLSKDASRNSISFLDEFGLQQQVTVPTHKRGGISDQVITSEEVEESEPLHKHENLAAKKAFCRKWRNFEVVAFAESIVA